MKNTILCVICSAVMFFANSCDVFCSDFKSAECGESPNQEIDAFEISITTGDEPTDMNIHLCWNRKSTTDRECAYLDNEWVDDFEAWQTDTFTVGLSEPIEVGDLESFHILNSGGGFLEASWEIAGITLLAILPDNSTWLLYDEPEINCHNDIYEDEVYWPMACEW